MSCDEPGLQIPLGHLAGADQILHRLQATHPFPLSVLLVLTERCHLKCRHCYVPTGCAPTELSVEHLEGLLDELAGLGVLFLTITGGDPALRLDLEQVVAAAVDRRFYVRVKTSATLLDESRVEALAVAGLSEVHVSLYDDRPEAHDAVVKSPGAWHRSVAAMQQFVQRGVAVRMASLVMENNADRISRLVDLCEENGFQYLVDPRVFTRSDGDPAPVEFRARSEQLQHVVKDARLFDPVVLRDKPPRPPDAPPCSAGRSSAYIMPNGDVHLCQMLPMVLGNIRESMFRDIWLESADRRRFAEMRWSDLPDCATCDSSWVCMRCSGLALMETGDVAGVSPADCAIAGALARVCGRGSHEQP